MIGRLIRRLLKHDPADPIQYWSRRASQPGEVSVMWDNAKYNELADLDQWKFIQKYLPEHRQAVLDLGCGTGRMAKRLAETFECYEGVDIEAMVEEARRRLPELANKFVGASAQDYEYPEEKFDLVLSMGCVSAACKAEELPDTAGQMVRTTKPGGHIILIDPFHRWNLLARNCRLPPSQAVKIFTDAGVELVHWSGILFFPGRLVMTEIGLFSKHAWLTHIGYNTGEFCCKIAPRILSDYSTIVLRKSDRSS